MSVFAENRKARFDYEILETLEAGVELFGFEVKAVRAGQVELVGSYVIIRGGEAYLVNAKIQPLQPKNVLIEYDPTRARRLLLKKEEISRLAGLLETNHYLIPLNAHSKKNLIKLELGLARKRKKGDKREVIKKREVQKKIKRLED